MTINLKKSSIRFYISRVSVNPAGKQAIIPLCANEVHCTGSEAAAGLPYLIIPSAENSKAHE